MYLTNLILESDASDSVETFTINNAIALCDSLSEIPRDSFFIVVRFDSDEIFLEREVIEVDERVFVLYQVGADDLAAIIMHGESAQFHGCFYRSAYYGSCDEHEFSCIFATSDKGAIELLSKRFGELVR